MTETTPEEIAKEIKRVSAQIRKLRDGSLNDKAIAVLVNNVTGLPQRTILKVLDGIEALEDHYLKEES